MSVYSPFALQGVSDECARKSATFFTSGLVDLFQSANASLAAFYFYRYDGGSSYLSSIMDGGNDMYDWGNSIFVSQTFIPNNFSGSSLVYGFYSLESGLEIFVSPPNTYPHVTAVFLPAGNLSIICQGDTGSDGSGLVVNYLLNYTTPKAHGTIWANINYGASDPTIGDVWFSIESSEWGSELRGWVDGRKVRDNNYYRHDVQVEGTNLLLCKILLSRVNGQVIYPWEITEYVRTYVGSIPFQVREVQAAAPDSAWMPCALNATWGDIIADRTKYVQGGLGLDMVMGQTETWLCAHGHPCAPEEGDSMCYKYNESSEEFIPWGRNSDLNLF
eukprot:745814-Hanusia_phi.AAC.1